MATLTFFFPPGLLPTVTKKKRVVIVCKVGPDITFYSYVLVFFFPVLHTCRELPLRIKAFFLLLFSYLVGIMVALFFFFFFLVNGTATLFTPFLLPVTYRCIIGAGNILLLSV